MTTCHINQRKISIGKAIELRQISKKYPLMNTLQRGTYAEYGDFWALKDIDLAIDLGQTLGIIGRNGAGKTSLLNIIGGVLSPSNGDISIKGRVVGLFNLGVGFQDELSGKENIFLNGAILGIPKNEITEKLNSIVEFSELGNFINMPLGSYSQGMRLRLGFSIIANLDFDVLVIDEVLAVGDALFQNKCFERLMDFKRNGITMVITAQNMDLIERLSDRVALLDHGSLLFYGKPAEAIKNYYALLNNERFFVGPRQGNNSLICQTKRWAENKSDWGNELGSKEVIIASVEFLNRFGWKIKQVKSGKRLKIKVSLKVRNNIKEPHFGIALFREDGVYCYGPNTSFDGYELPELRPGKGWFTLEFKRLLLAPGKYRISIAVWDKKEVLPFNYQEGRYKLVISGNNYNGRLLNIPAIPKKHDLLDKRALINPQDNIENEFIGLSSVKLLNLSGEEKETILTNEPVKLRVDFKSLKVPGRNCFFWAGIYRDDNVYCQGFSIPIKEPLFIEPVFPSLPLLPGGYKVAVGVWDNNREEFLMYNQCGCKFNMVFNRQDHGTVYLEHKWKWNLPA